MGDDGRVNSSRTAPPARTELTVLPDTSCSAGPLTGGMGAEDAAELARTLKALADPARLRLLSLIADSPSAAACACDLTDPLGLICEPACQVGRAEHRRGWVLRRCSASVLARGRRQGWACLSTRGRD